MIFDWDELKRQANIDKHGLDFVDAVRFEWADATITTDDRKDYGEVRKNAVGRLDGMLVNLTYTMRGSTCRIISMRRESESRWTPP